MEFRLKNMKYDVPYRLKGTSIDAYRCSDETSIVRLVFEGSTDTQKTKDYPRQLRTLRDLEQFADPYQSSPGSQSSYRGCSAQTRIKFQTNLGWNIGFGVVAHKLQPNKKKMFIKSIINGNKEKKTI